jgi:hypothetical protein
MFVLDEFAIACELASVSVPALSVSHDQALFTVVISSVPAIVRHRIDPNVRIARQLQYCGRFSLRQQHARIA